MFRLPSTFRRLAVFGVLTVAGSLGLVSSAVASWPPWGVPSGTMPWEWPKYHGYQEQGYRAQSANPATVAESASKYGLRITIVAGVKHRARIRISRS